MLLPTCTNSLCRLCSRFFAESEERAAASRRSSSCCIRVGSSSSRNYLGPDDMIEQILVAKTGRYHKQDRRVSPTVRANAFVVMDLACTRVSGCARECVSALLTTDHSLHDTWLGGASARSYFVLLQEFLSMGEAFLAYCTLKVAGSTGRCNTGLQFIRRTFKAQGLSRALIESQSYLVEIGLRVDGQVGLLGEVLS